MKKAELSILLTADSEIRLLNRQYRGVDAATDVLSFSMVEGEPLDASFEGPLGDVVISIDTAMKQAADDFSRERLGVDEEWTLLDEVTFLLVHGVLHLIGHAHDEVGSAAEMEARERRLFERIRGEDDLAVD